MTQLEVKSVSWQTGFAENGRSMNHLTIDEIKTCCGLVIPHNRINTEVWLEYEGNGECEKCYDSCSDD